MTPELTADSPGEVSKYAPSTAGMTTKVVKGSIWTLAGQVAPLIVSLVATPFVIRMLGAEGYGVFILITLIPTYLAFADFGMSMASTKFASEAYAAGDDEREARIVRTAGLIGLLASLPFGISIVALSGWVVTLFNVPSHLLGEASMALKFASVTFVINFLNNIFNTPQLTRLRMDLTTLVGFIPKVLGMVALPLVIYLGGGIIGATLVLMTASLITLAGQIYTSGRLLPKLKGLSIDRSVISPLTKFGSGLVVAGIAGAFLVNLEKAVLARVSSVEALAYYAVAFTLATMATTFSGAMLQSLVPAFSQLLAPEKREQLQSLFARSVRMNIVGMIPILVGIFVVARPFLTNWAGEDFGIESTWPLYVLIVGLFFNIVAHIPHSLLIADGHTGLIARLYLIELVPHMILTVVLAALFGAVGAAIAWTTRVMVDGFLIEYFAYKKVGIRFQIFEDGALKFALLSSIFCVSMITAAFSEAFSVLPLLAFAIASLVYCFFVWRSFITAAERDWLVAKVHALIH